jgi:peroxiredoxin
VLAPAAPEARGNHRAGNWRQRLGAEGWHCGKFLVAAALIFAAPTATTVRAADTALKTWTQPPPSLSLDTTAGGRIDLAQLRGNVVLVHFFATWCEPCRAEFASLQKLAGRTQPGRVAVVAVDAGEADRTVQRFVATLPLPFPVLLDSDRSVAKAWQVEVLPTTFLLDSDLVRRFVVEGDLDWNGPDAEAALTKLMASRAATAKAGPMFAPFGFDKE